MLTNVAGGVRVMTDGGGVIRGARTASEGTDASPSNKAAGSLAIGAGAPLIVHKPAGGAIELPEARDGADLRTGGGAVRIGRAGGPVTVSTGGGDVTLDAVNGAVRASTGAGAVTVTMVGDPRRGERAVDLHTGHGPITLTLPDGIDASFDIETAYTNTPGQRRTEIRSDFPLSRSETAAWFSAHRNQTPRRFVRAVGLAGSGRHRIVIRAVNGDVQIRRARAQSAPGPDTPARGDSARRAPTTG